MQSRETSDGFVVLKLDDGEDVMICLNIAILDHKIESAFIVAGIGMLRDAEIGFFNGGGYEKKLLAEPHELTSLQGSISTLDEVIIHLHCNLADASHRIIGGHLFSAKACVLNEILIKKTDVRLGRKLNPDTGLKELYLA
ncbi:MAG: DNA-binding protein [Candidatus Thermoplasmatota archaeon]|nr:DNA-binding protein [Candidatus Thermoplasmatota archaeon]MBU4070855.1 DNA-binding protein [Candidatus Thermoplasmatota archaeon]MBU4143412.1 DNA-binding protein [Candidatus Thermoplasmatota archaeon]MBU4592441.1 DNA-binding protein [Candidatus Thermoplasmatota archaeon]